MRVRTQQWVHEQRLYLLQKLTEAIDSVFVSMTEAHAAAEPVEDIAETAERKRGGILSALVFAAVGSVGAMYSNVMQVMCLDADCEHYTWMTWGDDRVRPDHARLDGTRQSWHSPPIVNLATGKTGHPGDDYGCRCIAAPVFVKPINNLGG